MKKLIYALSILALVSGCTPREAAAPQKQNEDFVQEGIQFLSKGDSFSAIAKFKGAIAQDPKNAKPYFVLAQTYMSLGDYNNALENFKTVSELDPTNGDAYLLLGGCYDLLGKKTEAIESVQKSVSIFQKNRDETNFKRALSILWTLTGTKPQSK